MKTNKIFYLLIFILVQISCTTKTVEKYDANIINPQILSSIKPEQVFKFGVCNKTPFRWDSVIILAPYCPAGMLKKENLVNYKSIENMFPELTLDEGSCVLLFLENDNIVRYSFIPRIPLDFNELVGANSSTLRVSKEKLCNNLFIKKNNLKFSLYFN